MIGAPQRLSLPAMSDDNEPGTGDGIFGNRADEEIYEAFPQTPIAYGMDPQDGLPRPAIQHAVQMAYAPPLSPDTLVCMADTSAFVLRDKWERVIVQFSPTEVERMPNGAYVVATALAAARVAKTDPRAAYVLDDGDPSNNGPRDILSAALGVVTAEVDRDWTSVAPLRPQCRHYARQMIDFQDDPDAKFVTRLCTARRNSEEGFLSVRDSQVYACELREPKHWVSAARLDTFDAEKVRLGRERTENDEGFDVEAALAAQQNEEPNERSD